MHLCPSLLYNCYRPCRQTYKKEEGSLTAIIYTIGIMKNYTNVIALVTTILLFIGFAGPAQAAPEVQQPTRVEAPVSAPLVPLTFDRVKITTSHTSTPVPIPIVALSSPKAYTPAPAATTTTTTPPPAPVAPAPIVASYGGSSALLASAYSQIGQIQDCTAMVERALGSIGIITGDLAPAQFFRFGSVVSTPAPGDILISAGHVGIYSGNGMMVSGGFNGNQTVEHPVSYVGAYTAVRVA